MSNTKTYKGLVSDIDISEEPHKVQKMCWQLLDIIMLENSGEEDAEEQSRHAYNMWEKKADRLPHAQRLTLGEFSATLRWEEITENDVDSGRWGQRTRKGDFNPFSSRQDVH